MHITVSNNVTFPILLQEYSGLEVHYRLHQLFQSSKDPSVGYWLG